MNSSWILIDSTVGMVGTSSVALDSFVASCVLMISVELSEGVDVTGFFTASIGREVVSDTIGSITSEASRTCW